jgi:hypothetical protein
LSAFAETVSASVGDREGSVVMLALSSPTGYLAVSRDAAAGAQPVGSGTVDGVHVDYFEVTLTPAQMAAVPGTSREQAKTIANALHVLAAEGYTGTTMRIAIGDDGLIHALRSTANFEDGAKVTLATTFSQFGCVRQATPAHAACVLAK